MILHNRQRYQPASILTGRGGSGGVASASSSSSSVVNYWSDNLLPDINFHNKSLFLLPGIHHYSTPFDKYATGYEYGNNSSQHSDSVNGDLMDDIYDRIRYFMEQCDWFQGFQVFCSMNDAFCGMIPQITKLLNDEFKVGHGHRKTLLLYDCQPSYKTIPITMRGDLLSSINSNNQNNNIINPAISQTIEFRNEINTIVGMTRVWEDITCYVPINTNYWRMNRQKRSKNKNTNINININNTNGLNSVNDIDTKLKETSIMGTAIHSSMNVCRLNTGNSGGGGNDGKHANYLRLRYSDVFDKLLLSANSHKVSMLSCNSSHLNLNVNYQSMSEIESVLSYDESSYNRSLNKFDNHPIFPKLECLGPINQSWFDMKYDFHSFDKSQKQIENENKQGQDNEHKSNRITTTLEDLRSGKSKTQKYRPPSLVFFFVVVCLIVQY